eukprot:Lankesteria_metandrocarpae@DN6602_c0_g1_i1.p1
MGSTQTGGSAMMTNGAGSTFGGGSAASAEGSAGGSTASGMHGQKPLPLFGGSAGGGAATDAGEETLVLVEKPEMYSKEQEKLVEPSENIAQFYTAVGQEPENWPVSAARTAGERVLALPVAPVFKLKATLVRNPDSGHVYVNSAFLGRQSTSDVDAFEFLFLKLTKAQRNALARSQAKTFQFWTKPVFNLMHGAEAAMIANKVGEASAGVAMKPSMPRNKVKFVGHEHVKSDGAALKTTYVVDHSMDVVRHPVMGGGGGAGGAG